MILVTGGTGLVGGLLLMKLAEKGLSVRAIYRSENSIAKFENTTQYFPNATELHKKIEWVEADVLDLYSLQPHFEGIEYVYHCAGYVSFSTKEKENLYNINVKGTANIVNLSLKFGVKKICSISSIAALSQKLKDQVITEENDWEQDKKNSWYSRTKYWGELEIWRGINEGLPAVIVNPSIIIGPGNWDESSGKLFSTVYKGLKFHTSGITGYVGSEDVCNAMIQLLKSDIENERYVLSEKDLSFKDLFTLIANSLNKKPPTMAASPLMMKMAHLASQALALLTGKEPLLTRSSVRSAFTKKYYSSEKIKKALNFEFTPIEEVIEKTGEIFLKNILK